MYIAQSKTHKLEKVRGVNQMLKLRSPTKWVISVFYISATCSILSQELDSYPVNLFWGDTHVHTYLSSDAFATGTTITSDQAYRFAKGEGLRQMVGNTRQYEHLSIL